MDAGSDRPALALARQPVRWTFVPWPGGEDVGARDSGLARRRRACRTWLRPAGRRVTSLSTHILDIERGLPATGVRIELYRGEQPLAQVETDLDGRVPDLAGGSV